MKGILIAAKQVVGFVPLPITAIWTQSVLAFAVACLISLITYVVVHVLAPTMHILMADWFIRRNDPEEFNAGGVNYKRRSKPP